MQLCGYYYSNTTKHKRTGLHIVTQKENITMQIINLNSITLSCQLESEFSSDFSVKEAQEYYALVLNILCLT